MINFIKTSKYLLLRRTVQLIIIMAFVIELPVIGRIASGNLSSSLWFGELALTDPYILLQSFVAGASLSSIAIVGAALIGVFYALFGGRIYCSWVCPINILTDVAYWFRNKLNIKRNLVLSKKLRHSILLLSLLLSALSSTLFWERINPITLLQREILWTSLAGSMVLLSIFLFDLLVTRRGWCGHLCPVGAFYSVLGRYGRIKVRLKDTVYRKGMDWSTCVKVCPEPHVLAPVVSGKSNVVTSPDCTRCGACVDACSSKGLSMTFKLVDGNTFKGIKISHSKIN